MNIRLFESLEQAVVAELSMPFVEALDFRGYAVVDGVVLSGRHNGVPSVASGRLPLPRFLRVVR